MINQQHDKPDNTANHKRQTSAPFMGLLNRGQAYLFACTAKRDDGVMKPQDADLAENKAPCQPNAEHTQRICTLKTASPEHKHHTAEQGRAMCDFKEAYFAEEFSYQGKNLFLAACIHDWLALSKSACAEGLKAGLSPDGVLFPASAAKAIFLPSSTPH